MDEQMEGCVPAGDAIDAAGELRQALSRIFAGHSHTDENRDSLTGSMRGAHVALMSLADKDGTPRPLSPSKLAEISHVSNARMANILRMLEGKGLVERTPSSSDRRRVTVRLTEKGLAEHGRHRELRRAYADRFVRDMGTEDVQELTRLLNKAADVVGRMKEEQEERR